MSRTSWIHRIVAVRVSDALVSSDRIIHALIHRGEVFCRPRAIRSTPRTARAEARPNNQTGDGQEDDGVNWAMGFHGSAIPREANRKTSRAIATMTQMIHLIGSGMLGGPANLLTSQTTK
jgi:hypothetical protein